MSATTNDDFDFDEWAALYRDDPDAFEARRRTVLAIELARADDRCREAGRRALERYERSAASLPAGDRPALAFELMRESLLELEDRLGELRDESAGGVGKTSPGV